MPTIINTKRTMEAAALLLFFSFFVLIEGTLRMTRYSKPTTNDSINYGDDADGTQVPYGVLLAYACFEVFIGLIGICIGLFQLLFQLGWQRLTNGFAILQSILAAFVILTYAVAVPSIEADHTIGIVGVLSAKEHRHLIIFGSLLSSISFSLALLGGQFVMILRLLMAQTKQPDTKDALHTMVWSGNQIVIAISTLYVGILLATRDFSSDTEPVRLQPHIVWYPVISIIAGAILLLYGVAGVLAANNAFVAERLPFAWIVGFITMLVNFSWTFGLAPGDLSSSDVTVAVQQAGIAFAVTILPVFHAWRLHHPLEEIFNSTTTAKINTTPPFEQPMPQTPQREESTEDMEC